MPVPTTRPRHYVTETDELAAALDAAALRWPDAAHAVNCWSDWPSPPARRERAAEQERRERARLRRTASDSSSEGIPSRRISSPTIWRSSARIMAGRRSSAGSPACLSRGADTAGRASSPRSASARWLTATVRRPQCIVDRQQIDHDRGVQDAGLGNQRAGHARGSRSHDPSSMSAESKRSARHRSAANLSSGLPEEARSSPDECDAAVVAGAPPRQVPSRVTMKSAVTVTPPRAGLRHLSLREVRAD